MRRVATGCAVLLSFALVGCGQKQVPAQAVRPALVVQPSGGAEAAVSAFAGEVRAREESPLSFRIGGNLVRREVSTGDRVMKGQLLAVLDPGDQTLQAQAASAQLTAAEADLARARGDLARYSKLVEQQLISRSAYDAQVAAFKAAEGQAKAARAQAALTQNQTGYTQLRAPRDGVIASRQAEAGQVVGAGQTIFTLAADSGRDVAIAIPENRIREFQVGMPVLVELWNRPGERLTGSLRELSAAADPQTRTYSAKVLLPGEAANAVELGQSARVYVQDRADGAAALSVPLSAVQRGEGGATSVWVVNLQSGKISARKVVLGRYGETEVPVLSGLQASDWVVAAGGHLLAEAQTVSPVDRDNKPVALKPAAAKAATAQQAN